MYLHLSTIHFYHFVIVTLHTHFLTIHFLTKNYEKACTELSKNAEKKRSQKSKRSDIKYFLTIHFSTETTQNCANFVGLLLGRRGHRTGCGHCMGRFCPSCVRLVYFLRKSTEFHVKRTECQRILFHFLLVIFS